MRTHRFLAAALAVVMLTLTIASAGAAAQPLLIAHRGGAGLWPENTMTAFRNAATMFADAGVDGWLELDTQFTSDHVLVVMHDATLDRTTNCSGALVDTPSEQVTQCDADPDPIAVDPVPTLAQVVDEGVRAGWRLMVEIKNIPGEPGFDFDCHELADALIATVNAAGFPVQNLIVESFWPLCLDRLEKKAPAIPTLLLTSSTTVNDLAGIATPVPLGFTLTANAVFATLRGYEYASPDQDAIDLLAPVVTAAHLLGRRVVVWTVDDPGRMTALARIGVDGLISNRPDLLISTLAG
jgi:glycerophosphoryl diester phosphodiesterase